MKRRIIKTYKNRRTTKHIDMNIKDITPCNS